jgi:glycosyltransferase involved in cell wall biosynthesis
MYDHKARILDVRLRNLFLDLFSLAEFHGLLSTCDAVHFNDFNGTLDMLRCSLLLLILKAKHVKVVFGFRTAGIEESISRAPMRGLYNFFFRRVSKWWDLAICNSKYSANLLSMRYGIPPSKIRVIPNGVDIRLHRDAEACQLAGNPAILFVGHLQPSKGTDLALRAFRLVNDELPESRLHVVGAGTDMYEKRYRELIVELNIKTKVELHGIKSKSELAKIYKGADMCVFPSRVESFGNVVLEAMASGKPIVASNVGGIPEVMRHDRNGLLVEPTAISISRALLKLSRDHELCERMSRNNIRDAMWHNWKQMSEAYVRLYEQICGRHQRTSSTTSHESHLVRT